MRHTSICCGPQRYAVCLAAILLAVACGSGPRATDHYALFLVDDSTPPDFYEKKRISAQLAVSVSYASESQESLLRAEYRKARGPDPSDLVLTLPLPASIPDSGSIRLAQEPAAIRLVVAPAVKDSITILVRRVPSSARLVGTWCVGSCRDSRRGRAIMVPFVY
jgi:hypothetical protein